VFLQLFDYRDGVETPGGNRVTYGVDTDEAWFGSAAVAGRALVFELAREESPKATVAAAVEPSEGWLMRCDRVDFPLGGVAYRHTHAGPGIRCLLEGELRVETEGTSRTYRPFEAWFESGPEPVLAEASETEETSFVRVLLLPGEWVGKRTIRYVDPADAMKPRTQRATIYLEEPLVL
jgi:quercetin dioxygenase-like cupin family protein